MITGGADSKIHPLSMVRMSLLDQMSTLGRRPGRKLAGRSTRPATDGSPARGPASSSSRSASTPWLRGAKVYGEILGFGSGCDACPAGGLDPDGIGTEIAIRAALRDAKLAPDAEIGHVNAHGAATVASDLAEARAIGRVFGEGPSSGRCPDDRPQGLPGQPRLRLRGRRADRKPPRGQSRFDTTDRAQLRRGRPGRPRPRPGDRAPLVRRTILTFLNTNLTRHGQAAAR